nr:ARM repeat superfamily protein [Tanacetum cinerariifolium]
MVPCFELELEKRRVAKWKRRADEPRICANRYNKNVCALEDKLESSHRHFRNLVCHTNKRVRADHHRSKEPVLSTILQISRPLDPICQIASQPRAPEPPYAPPPPPPLSTLHGVVSPPPLQDVVPSLQPPPPPLMYEAPAPSKISAPPIQVVPPPPARPSLAPPHPPLVTATRFFDTLTLCLSQNSVFAGSLDKLLLEKPSSVGYFRSITEMKAINTFENRKTASVESNPYEDPNSYKIQNEYDLPRMPPWFLLQENQKLCQSLARILRLVSLSLVAVIKDIPLSYLRKLIGDVRNNEYMIESWQSWYKRTNSGKLVRQASTAICILNEMVFGLSDQAIDNKKSMFRNNIFGWDVCSNRDLRSQLIDSIGTILQSIYPPNSGIYH